MTRLFGSRPGKIALDNIGDNNVNNGATYRLDTIAKSTLMDSEILKSKELIRELSRELGVDITDPKAISTDTYNISKEDAILAENAYKNLHEINNNKKGRYDINYVYPATRNIEYSIALISNRHTYWRTQSFIYEIRSNACIENKKYHDFLLTKLISISYSNLADHMAFSFSFIRNHMGSITDSVSYLSEWIEDYEEILKHAHIANTKEFSDEVVDLMFEKLLAEIGIPSSLLTQDIDEIDNANTLALMNSDRVAIPYPDHFKSIMHFRCAKPIFPENSFLMKNIPEVLRKYSQTPS